MRALVRNWEFQQPAAVGFGGEINPLRLLRRRSSLVVDDLSATRRRVSLEKLQEGVRVSQSGFAPPSVFVEPDATSLLDSFGL